MIYYLAQPKNRGRYETNYTITYGLNPSLSHKPVDVMYLTGKMSQIMRFLGNGFVFLVFFSYT